MFFGYRPNAQHKEHIMSRWLLDRLCLILTVVLAASIPIMSTHRRGRCNQGADQRAARR